jgi:hypothetical protein
MCIRVVTQAIYQMRPSFIARIYNIYTPMLGRWTINYNYNIQNWKIDNANTDHCGCCDVTYSDLVTKTNVKTDEKDDELVPYCM